MGGPPRVAVLGLKRPANSDFDAEYAERTQTCQAETEARSDKEKTKAIKDDTEKLETEHKHGMKLHRKRIEQIMFQDIRGFTKVYAKMMTFIKHEVRILMVGLEADEKTTILYS